MRGIPPRTCWILPLADQSNPPFLFRRFLPRRFLNPPDVRAFSAHPICTILFSPPKRRSRGHSPPHPSHLLLFPQRTSQLSSLPIARLLRQLRLCFFSNQKNPYQ